MKRVWLKLDYIQSSTISLIYVFWFDMILARSPTPRSNSSHAAHHTIWKIWRAHIKKTKAFIKVQIPSVTVSHASHATKKSDFDWFFLIPQFWWSQAAIERRTTTESVSGSMKSRKEFSVCLTIAGEEKMQKMRSRRVKPVVFVTESESYYGLFYINSKPRAHMHKHTRAGRREHRHLKWKVEY